MSGVEIVEKIHRGTNGRWKPSPGSLYPLLASLRDNDYTKELPKEKIGVKRYKLTDKGEKFFEEQTRFGETLRKKLEFLAPMLIGSFELDIKGERLREIRDPVKRLVMTLLDLRTVLKENSTDRTMREVAEILNGTVEKLKLLIERIKMERQVDSP